MAILITGATGFIGRHLCAHLTAGNHEVLALMRRPDQLSTLRETVNALGGQGIRIRALAGNLDQLPKALYESLPRPEAIVHLGARFAWQLGEKEAHTTNVGGSLAIADAARHLGCRLVFVSGFMLENHAHLHRLGINTVDPSKTDWARVYRRAGAYEASKLEAAFRVRSQVARGLDLVEVQPATVAGHSHTGELDRAQPLYQLIDNLARGRMAMVPGTPEHWLPLVAVDHLAAMLGRAALSRRPPGTLLALDPKTPPLQPMLALIAQVLGRVAPQRHIPIPVLSALLRMPGLSQLMNTYPEALHFIQTTRFDTNVADGFTRAEGLAGPDISEAIRASAGFYRKQSS